MKMWFNQPKGNKRAIELQKYWQITRLVLVEIQLTT